MIFADFHCDTASLLLDGRALYQNEGMLSIRYLQEAGVFLQYFAMFIRLSEFSGPEESYEYLLRMYKNFIAELEQNREHIALARTASDVHALRESGKIAAVLSLEEGGVLGERLPLLDELFKMGVRLITLTWNFENSLGYPNSEDSSVMSKGLKPFGIQVVERMEELGMIIDVSHLSDGGFWDVARVCKKPFIASHSNARSLCGHQRNLTDEMLKTLAEAGGVTGINFYHRFLGSDEIGSIAQMVEHARHIYNVAGIDVLALGSDFDGFSGPCGLADCGQLQMLADAFEMGGFSESEIEKICWKNAMRVIDELL